MRSLLRLPIAICRVSSCLFVSSSIPKCRSSMSSTAALARIMSRRFFLPSAMKFSGQWSLNSQLLNYSPKETRSQNASNTSFPKGQPTSTSSSITWPSLISPSARSILRPLRVLPFIFRQASRPAGSRKSKIRGRASKGGKKEYDYQG